ncbi:PspC domain-containing protein [Promicromonospora panici]|uniref:PspC domain-containing protein n=1 Tax=Promicromonospora panici TaxID=2219658 RepID=UPI0013EC1C9B|nr:PspC domain-containing protein [Promicromonospora panici]
MSTDETRPQGATPEPGGPADESSVGPDTVYTGPAYEPATDPATGPTADPAPVAPGQRPYAESGFFASIRRGLFPRSEQRWVGGVAGGVAERIGWDPLLVRGLLILSFFLGGLGLILYGIGWALLPERDGRIHLQEATRGNFDVAMLGSVAVFLVGFAWGGPLGWWDDGGGWGWLGFFFWITVLGVVCYLIVQGVQRARDNSAARQSGTYAGPAPRAGEPGTTAPFTPAPPADYRRSDGLVYASGAGPAPYRQTQAQYRPAPGAVPVPQPVYTAPPARVRRGPGSTAVGVSLGVILLIGALLLAADRVGAVDFTDGNSGLGTVWLGIATVVLGIAIFVSGLRGRSSGWLGFFAIVALLFGMAYIAVVGDGRDWAEDAVVRGGEIEELVNEPNDPDAATITEGTIAVQTIREAEDGFYVRWGDPTIDLTELNLSGVEPGDPVVVPIQLGAGQTVVLVPEDVAVEANAYVAAGVVQWNVDDQDRSSSGVGSDNYFASDEVGDDGAVLSLDIEAGAGEVIVSESRGGDTP